jgi:hypothetical protein
VQTAVQVTVVNHLTRLLVTLPRPARGLQG